MNNKTVLTVVLSVLGLLLTGVTVWLGVFNTKYSLLEKENTRLKEEVLQLKSVDCSAMLPKKDSIKTGTTYTNTAEAVSISVKNIIFANNNRGNVVFCRVAADGVSRDAEMCVGDSVRTGYKNGVEVTLVEANIANARFTVSSTDERKQNNIKTVLK